MVSYFDIIYIAYKLYPILPKIYYDIITSPQLSKTTEHLPDE